MIALRKPDVKLKPDQVDALVLGRQAGRTWKDLARQFNITETTARHHFRRWTSEIQDMSAWRPSSTNGRS